MTKISYEERINLYYDRKNGMSFPSIKSKYGINKSGVEYLVKLIVKHGFDILRINENKSYSSNEKERILNRILIDNESILSNFFNIFLNYAIIVIEVSCINLYSDSFKLSYLSLH